MKPKHPSVDRLRDDYFAAHGGTPRELPHWFFCDNQQDADECAALVLTGDKRATASSLWWFGANKEPLPRKGDLNIVTDWAGVAKCVIETVDVEVVQFDQITEEHAYEEGEGDKSLEYWKRVHWAFYTRELEGTGLEPRKEMSIVFERFRVVQRALDASDSASRSR